MSYAKADYVKNIRGLMVGKNADLDRLAGVVDEFIDAVPELTESMKAAVDSAAKFYPLVQQAVSMLGRVNALWLKNDGEKILRIMDDRKNTAFESYSVKARAFIANLLSLSISMQTSKNNLAAAEPFGMNNVEFLADIVKNLQTAKELIDDSRTAEAAGIISDMSVLDSDETARELLAALRANRESGGLITDIIGKYNTEIERVLSGHSGFDRKIMLVDDRPEILETVGGYLKDTYTVIPLTRGTLALKAIEKQKIDLFVLDIDMPDMDGITLANKIRALPDYKQTPIIILTSNATREYVVAAMQAGANDFIVKPANKNTLAAKVADFIKADS